MALSSIALATVAEVKEILGITDGENDTAIERQINAVSKQIENYVQNALIIQTFTEQIFDDGRTRTRVRLRRYPIQSVTSITDQDLDTVASTDYRIWKPYGYLAPIGSWPRPEGWWDVIYSAGRFASTATVDDALKAICAELVATRLARPDPSVTSKKVGDLSLTWGAGPIGTDQDLPARIKLDLSPYKNWQV